MGKKRRNSINRNKEQTTLNYTTVDEEPNTNVSYPYGLIRTVRHYLDFIGLMRYLRSLKKKGVRLDLIVLALCAFTLYESNSIDACSKWLEDPRIRREIGFRKDEDVSQKTIDRAVERFSDNREGILRALYEGVVSKFEMDDYDITMDGSAVIIHGPKSAMASLGYPRDGKPGDLQVQFMVAILSQLDIPVYVKPFVGNAPDERQYAEAMPEIRALIDGKRFDQLEEYKKQGMELQSLVALTKVATTIIADNGAASKENSDRAKKLGFERLTRVKMNASDDKHIVENILEFEYIEEEGVMCYTHTYDNSKRTTYLICSPELLKRKVKTAVASVRRGAAIYEDMLKNGVKKSKVVKVRKIPGIDVYYDVVLRERWLPFSERQINLEGREKAGIRAGFFKLESSVQLTPAEAISIYRNRAIVEQTISSLKRVTGIKPLRVWSEKSIEGSMVLAILAEAAISMARYCLKSRYKPVDVRSGHRVETHVPSTRTIVQDLSHLTLTRSKVRKGPWDACLSNWTPLCEAVFADIGAHESSEWGSKKVPLPA